MSIKTARILGFDIISSCREDVLIDITDSIESGNKFRWVACMNPHSYVVAKKDNVFRQALQNADWLIPDGSGVLIGGRLLGWPFSERITGFDIFAGVMDSLEKRGGSVFFLGSTQSTLELIEMKIAENYPNVRVVGSYSPPFKDEFDNNDSGKMLAAVSEAQPDVLWVGLTAPKQEKWIAQHTDDLPDCFVGAVGAVFDFYSGGVKRSPKVFQRLGLEWLPRLLKQPRKLWRRTLVSAPIFIWDILCSRISKNSNIQ